MEKEQVEYASSCNGLDEVSCGSSMVSCCSVYEDPCAIIPDDSQMPSINTSATGGGVGGGTGGEGTSEGGSESSSLAGSCSGPRSGRGTSAKRSSFASSSSSNVSTGLGKKKPEAKGTNQGSSEGSRASATPRTKVRGSIGTAATPKASSSTRNVPSSLGSRDRGRSRDGRSTTRELCQVTTPTSNNNNTSERRGSGSSKVRVSSGTGSASSNVTVRTRTRQLPDSLPSSLTTEIDRDLAAHRGRAATSKSRGALSSSRGRATPGSTPCDESRKSIVASKSSYTPRAEKSATASSNEDKSLDTYATLPRTKNRAAFSLVKSVDRADDIFGKSECNREKSRDTSLSRINGMKKPRVPNTRDSLASRKCLPPYPRTKSGEKTRIYHEIAVQTGLTGQDIENVFAGVEIPQHDPRNVERLQAQSQTEEVWQDVRSVKNQLKNLTSDANLLKIDNEKLAAENKKLERLLAEERADHAFARQELDKNARRVLAMLGTPQSEHDEASDSFLELETHFQSSGQVVASQQVEIADLQSLCRMLNRVPIQIFPLYLQLAALAGLPASLTCRVEIFFFSKSSNCFYGNRYNFFSTNWQSFFIYYQFPIACER